MTADYQFRVFGVPALFDGEGREIPLRTRKQYAVLLYLVLEGRERAVPRDRLGALLWPDVSRERARHSLSQALTEIRCRLGREVFSRGGDVLRLTVDIVTELDGFDADGPCPSLDDPLLGADDYAGADFAHWVDAARERCKRHLISMLREHIRELQQGGKLERTGDFARMLYELDPLSDVAVQILAERALLQGNLVEAIFLLRAHVSRVESELGCNPHESLTRLLRRLEAGNARPPTSPANALFDKAAVSLPRLFVGREEELAKLEKGWRLAQDNGFGSCLISGPRGMGKSSLLRRFASTVAARAYPTVFIVCHEIGTGIPFAVTGDLISALVAEPELGATDPMWLAEASRIAPSLREAYPGVPPPPDMPPEATKLRLAEALSQMIQTVSDTQPMLIAIDDAQYVDPGTRDILYLLERRLEGSKVFLVGTYTLESAPVQYEGIRGPAGVTWHSALEVSPLGVAEVRELINHLMSGDGTSPRKDVQSKIAELSQGNPYYIEILVTDWKRHGTGSLIASELRDVPTPMEGRRLPTERHMLARVHESLSDLGRQVVNAVAVAKRALLPAEIEATLEAETNHLYSELVSLVEHNLLGFDRARLMVKNELYRAYAYYAMPFDLRRLYHARLGNALRKLASDETDARLLEAALHLFLGGETVEARKLLLTAAERAIKLGAPAEAERALRVVFPEGGRDLTACCLLAEALSAQGKYREVERLCSMELSRQNGGQHAEAFLAVLRLEACQRGRLYPESSITRMSVEARRMLEDLEASTSLKLRALQAIAEIASETNEDTALGAILDEALQVANEVNLEEHRGRALMTAGYCHFVSHRADAARQCFFQSLECFDVRGFEPERARILNGIGGAFLLDGDVGAGFQNFRKAAQLAKALRDFGRLSTIASNLGAGYEWMGMFTDAAYAYERADLLNSQTTTPRNTVSVTLNRFDLALILGDITEARTQLTRAREAAAAAKSELLDFRADVAEADLHLATGEPERAWILLERVLAEKRIRFGALGDVARVARLLALLDVTQGRDPHKANAAPYASRLKTVVQWIEYRGTLEWLYTRNKQIAVAAGESALQIARKRGLIGIIARLTAMGIYPWNVPLRGDSETARDLIARAFGDTQKRDIPAWPDIAF